MKPYYDDGTVTIYHGDALDVIPDLAPVDLVVTDPPYFQPATHYVPARGVAPIRSLGDTSVLEYAFSAWARALEHVTPEGTGLYVFCDGQSYPIVFRTFYPLGRVRPLIWDKIVSFNGYTWRHQHEIIAWVEPTGSVRVRLKMCGGEHRGSCANCRPWAMRWRSRIVDGLGLFAEVAA